MEVITLLNDGTTWTSLDGSKVVAITDRNFRAVEGGKDPLPLAAHVFELNNPAHLRALADALEQSTR